MRRRLPTGAARPAWRKPSPVTESLSHDRPPRARDRLSFPGSCRVSTSPRDVAGDVAAGALPSVRTRAAVPSEEHRRSYSVLGNAGLIPGKALGHADDVGAVSGA